MNKETLLCALALDENIPPRDKVVLNIMLVLSTLDEESNLACAPTIEEIGRLAAMSAVSVRYRIGKLKEAGYITVESGRVKGLNQHKRNIYTLESKKLVDIARSCRYKQSVITSMVIEKWALKQGQLEAKNYGY